MRSTTVRTRNAEKREKLNRERSAEKEVDRSTSRENLLNRKRGRGWLLRVEGNYSTCSSSHIERANCCLNDMTEAAKSLESDGRSSNNEEVVMSKQKSPEDNTTNSMEDDASWEHRISTHKHGGKPN